MKMKETFELMEDVFVDVEAFKNGFFVPLPLVLLTRKKKVVGKIVGYYDNQTKIIICFDRGSVWVVEPKHIWKLKNENYHRIRKGKIE